MPLIPVGDLRPGHFIRQGRTFAHVTRPPYETKGYVEVPTTSGMWRFPPRSDVFVAATEPRRSA